MSNRLRHSCHRWVCCENFNLLLNRCVCSDKFSFEGFSTICCRVPAHSASLFAILIPNRQSRAQSTASISRRRLNPNIFENTFPQKPAVSNTVESNAAGHTKIIDIQFFFNCSAQPQNNFFSNNLNGSGNVHFPLSQFSFSLTRRTFKQPVKLLVCHE